jgi:hypothetical protein
MDRSF